MGPPRRSGRGWRRCRRRSAAAARAFAADVRVLSVLAAQVPRCARDESGGTPWTSFRQELAVARQVSGQAAAAELRIAVRLTSVLPHTLALLEAGPDHGGAGADVRDRAGRARRRRWRRSWTATLLSGWRNAGAVGGSRTRCAGPGAGAGPGRGRRSAPAAATAQRDVTLQPMAGRAGVRDDHGSGGALVRWYATLDARARALRAAGDRATSPRCGSTSRPAPSPA